jgi:hypothetical protein
MERIAHIVAQRLITKTRRTTKITKNDLVTRARLFFLALSAFVNKVRALTGSVQTCAVWQRMNGFRQDRPILMSTRMELREVTCGKSCLRRMKVNR